MLNTDEVVVPVEPVELDSLDAVESEPVVAGHADVAVPDAPELVVPVTEVAAEAAELVESPVVTEPVADVVEAPVEEVPAADPVVEVVSDPGYDDVFGPDGWLTQPPYPLEAVCATAPTWWECYLLGEDPMELPAFDFTVEDAVVWHPEEAAPVSSVVPVSSEELAVTGGGEVLGLLLLGGVALAAGGALVMRGRRAVAR